MGVLACDRKGCDNIMCDICADNMYVCYECAEEFKGYLAARDIHVETEGEIRRELRSFMATVKGDYDTGQAMTVDEFFKKNNRGYEE